MLRKVLFVAALAASSLASGQSLEPLSGIARLSYVEGDIRFQAEKDSEPSGLPERPLIAGDRLTTDKRGRAELNLGSGTLRTSGHTEISLKELGAKSSRVELAAGSASLHLRDLLEGETFAIDTPSVTIDFLATGEYRVDVFDNGATELAVRNGLAEIATAGGPVRVSDGQRVRIESRDAYAALMSPQDADDFDEWVLEREVQLANNSPQEAPDEYYDESLARYGEWRDDASYGRVWMPAYAYGGYDPFGNGYWQYNGYGYSWYDPMPWSRYTHGYGRWAYLNDRWCWVPRQRHRWVASRDRDDDRPVGIPLGSGRPRDSGGGKGQPQAITPRRLGTGQTPVLRESASMKPSQRETPAPRVNRQQPAPAPSASPPRSNGTPTMRPSQPSSSARREATSTPAPTTNREVGKIRPD